MCCRVQDHNVSAVCLVRIRALYGQIMEKDAVISVLHFQLQQEQDNGEEGEGVSSGCPAHSDPSSSDNKGKNVIVRVVPVLFIPNVHQHFSNLVQNTHTYGNEGWKNRMS